MMPGALQKVLKEIGHGHDIYLCKHLNCSLDMQRVLSEHPVLDLDSDTVFDLSDPKERLRYFGLAQTTEAFFSFMGSIIIKRNTWNSVPSMSGSWKLLGTRRKALRDNEGRMHPEVSCRVVSQEAGRECFIRAARGSSIA